MIPPQDYPDPQYIEEQRAHELGMMEGQSEHPTPAFSQANQSAEFLRWQLDSSDILEQVEKRLQGYVWMGDHWEKKGEEFMNDEGVRSFLSLVSAFVHKNLITSIYSRQEILDRLKHIGRTVINLIYENWEEFEINKTKTQEIVDIIVLGQIEPAYRRALDGKLLRALSTMTKHVESSTNTQNPRRTGGVAKFWKKF